MPWICPKCGRQFKHATNYHSCVKVDADRHFINKKPEVKAMFEKILKETKKFGNVNVSPVQNSIMLKNASTFLAIKPKKEWADIEFFLPEEVHEFPVYKTARYTKNKVVHFVRLENPKEVDKQLMRWLKISYDLAGEKKKQFLMKKTLLPLLLIFLMPHTFLAQAQNRNCSLLDTATLVLKQNDVEQQWEYKIDKKTKKKTFNSVREFDASGCVTKIIYPDASAKGKYGVKEWEYDATGRLTLYRVGTIDKDSAKTFSYSESYNYNPDGKVSRYRKEFFEGELSQTVIKRDYTYSDNNEIKESLYSVIRVRRDTISNDEIKLSAGNVPMERTVHNFLPKGFSDNTRYNSKGLPSEYILYDKGNMKEHKFYFYQYDSKGNFLEETISDGISKTKQTKRYEKDKIIFTSYNTKGKVLKKENLPLAFPSALPYPSLQPALQPESSADDSPKNKKVIQKEKKGKKGIKIIENYVVSSTGEKHSQKLSTIETYDQRGLIIKSDSVEGGFYLEYEYAFY